MIKFRQAYYCNLKAFLMVLVIYGHWIEPEIEHSRLLYTQYWWIYLLHMPLFAFLSGLFFAKLQGVRRTNKTATAILCYDAIVRNGVQ